MRQLKITVMRTDANTFDVFMGQILTRLCKSENAFAHMSDVSSSESFLAVARKPTLSFTNSASKDSPS